MFGGVFNNKKILITGHTGFKGSWMLSWLKKLNPKKITGISLDPPTTPSHFNSANLYKDINDIRVNLIDLNKVKKIFIKEKPDFIFHLAAKPLVKESYADPVETWQTNMIGTINILESLRYLNNKCSAIMITSDKSYENKEWVWGYRENDRLGGRDPYSASKSAAELAIKSYVNSFFSKNNNKIRIAVARAGNVIGGGDWSADRIVPDCIKAWSKNKTVKLRNPLSTRPWQHVIEPISGYLQLAKILDSNKKCHGEAFNFGPNFDEDRMVGQLVKDMGKHWEGSKWEYASKNYKGPSEAKLLRLNCDKALNLLDWQSAMNFSETMKLTIEWYKNYYKRKMSIAEMTKNQIEYYCKIAKKKKLVWTK